MTEHVRKLNKVLDQYEQRRQLERQRKAKRKPTPLPPDVWQRKVAGHPCRACGSRAVRLEAHHLVPRSRLRGPDLHHDDNVIPLCVTCHTNHHTTDKRVPRSVLLPAEIVFLQYHETSSWVDAWYPA